VSGLGKFQLAKLRQAQAAGNLTHRWDATAILVFVQSIASAWATLNPEFSATSAPDRGARRSAVTEAVARLIAPD
jgi:Tetracyclin repressor-like, C-terminal domain